MPNTQERARYIQWGRQSAFDAVAAATAKYPGALTPTETHDFYVPTYPQQVRTPDVINQKVNTVNGFTFTHETDMTFEELVTFLSASLKGGITPSGAGADKTWLWTPPPQADPSPNYYTVEFAPNDWTTNYLRKVPNVLISEIQITIAINEPIKVRVTAFGGAPAIGGSPTALLAPVTGREIVKSNAMKVYIDTSSAALGTTQKSGMVTRAVITIGTGLSPDYALEGRVNLDYGFYQPGDLTCTVEMTMKYNGNADAEFAAWRAGNARYIRLIGLGSLISASNKTFRLDGAYEYLAGGAIGTANNQDTATLTARAAYDGTWGKIIEAQVVNALAAAP